MKKITLALVLLMLATVCYSQTPVVPTPIQGASKYTKEYYLEKKEANMVRGWIFTPVGVVLMGASFAMAWNEVATGITSFGQNETDGTGSGILALAGVSSIIVGTVSFISAGSNKRKARSLAVGYEQVPSLQPGNAITKTVPTVGLKVAF
ncbi:hypothetical protein [Rufibacter hautae]|uniref:DUF4134 domain-containing protein n=1 Tax=Rufibacter hautae TaxID=2595005 RepID=A0A5B6TJ29_9BACT|nr:hypothetical protein [Rufibacter hautae]KAA3440036.1 hypothetical protein FOA19_05035 [Rufibacter hautae]